MNKFYTKQFSFRSSYLISLCFFLTGWSFEQLVWLEDDYAVLFVAVPSSSLVGVLTSGEASIQQSASDQIHVISGLPHLSGDIVHSNHSLSLGAII